MLPEDSVCLSQVGPELSVHCQNPSDLPGIRESGIYCYNPHTSPTYHVYYLDYFSRNMAVDVNFTIHLDKGTYILPFQCNTGTYGDCLYKGTSTVPFVETFLPILSGSLYRDQMATTDLAALYLVVPSSVPLYPFTPFPTDAFLVSSEGLLDSTSIKAPECQLDTNATNGTQTFPAASKIMMQDWFGADLETAALRSREFVPLTMYVNTTDAFIFSWLELDAYIPKRGYTGV